MKDRVEKRQNSENMVLRKAKKIYNSGSVQ